MTVLDSSDLPEFASSLEKTPRRVLLEDVARERLHTVAERNAGLIHRPRARAALLQL